MDLTSSLYVYFIVYCAYLTGMLLSGLAAIAREGMGLDPKDGLNLYLWVFVPLIIGAAVDVLVIG